MILVRGHDETVASRSADHGRFAMADRNRLAGLEGWAGDVDGVVDARRAAGRHAYQKDSNRSGPRNRQDLEVGFSVGKNR
jgi:hypothetical protein